MWRKYILKYKNEIKVKACETVSESLIAKK